MIVYLLRHGIAIDRTDPACPQESERFLTERGVARTRAAMRGLRALKIAPDLILSSPFMRARQTAQFAAEALSHEGELRFTDALLSEMEPEALLRELATLDDTNSVLCAGHAPQLDLFIAEASGCTLPITALKKSGLAVLDLNLDEPGDGHLVALYPPRVLRRLSKSL